MGILREPSQSWLLLVNINPNSCRKVFPLPLWSWWRWWSRFLQITFRLGLGFSFRLGIQTFSILYYIKVSYLHNNEIYSCISLHCLRSWIDGLSSWFTFNHFESIIELIDSFISLFFSSWLINSNQIERELNGWMKKEWELRYLINE